MKRKKLKKVILLLGSLAACSLVGLALWQGLASMHEKELLANEIKCKELGDAWWANFPKTSVIDLDPSIGVYKYSNPTMGFNQKSKTCYLYYSYTQYTNITTKAYDSLYWITLIDTLHNTNVEIWMGEKASTLTKELTEFLVDYTGDPTLDPDPFAGIPFTN